VCMDLACASQGADKLRDALVKAAEASGKKVLVRRTGCMGPCSQGRWCALIRKRRSTAM
jgi:NADH:ubiquinone oxidoreductase subunit E